MANAKEPVMTTAIKPPLQITIHPEEAKTASASTFWSGETPSFTDFLDTINPLQHIPIVSSIYQSISNDTLSYGAKIAGGALFGGPIGLLGSIFSSIFEQHAATGLPGSIQASADGSGYAEPERFLSANQRASYNAYAQAQRLG
jgi:hypothetical protein